MKFICLRLEQCRHPALPIPGSKRKSCCKCGTAIWVSPASLIEGAEWYCDGCALSLGDIQLAVTPEVVEAAEKYLQSQRNN